MYRTKQIGWMIVIITLLAVILQFVLLSFLPETEPDPTPYVIATTAVFFLLLLLFYQLETTVGQSDVIIKFGIGLIKKTIPLNNIKSTKEVKNSWWFGWGIRLTPYGWLWNIAGYDAVEIEFQNGKQFRLGCKNASELKEEIDKRL